MKTTSDTHSVWRRWLCLTPKCFANEAAEAMSSTARTAKCKRKLTNQRRSACLSDVAWSPMRVGHARATGNNVKIVLQVDGAILSTTPNVRHGRSHTFRCGCSHALIDGTLIPWKNFVLAHAHKCVTSFYCRELLAAKQTKQLVAFKQQEHH